jgi:hypothetical protein
MLSDIIVELLTMVRPKIIFLPQFYSTAINSDSDKLREFLHAKIAKRKKQIHPEHSARFNHDMQLQIDRKDRSKQGSQ